MSKRDLIKGDIHCALSMLKVRIPKEDGSLQEVNLDYSSVYMAVDGLMSALDEVLPKDEPSADDLIKAASTGIECLCGNPGGGTHLKWCGRHE